MKRIIVLLTSIANTGIPGRANISALISTVQNDSSISFTLDFSDPTTVTAAIIAQAVLQANGMGEATAYTADDVCLLLTGI